MLDSLIFSHTGCPCRHPEGFPAEQEQVPSQDLFVEPWWASKLSTGSAEWWLSAIDGARLAALPGKQRVGLINALVDLLRHLVSCQLSHHPHITTDYPSLMCNT